MQRTSVDNSRFFLFTVGYFHRGIIAPVEGIKEFTIQEAGINGTTHATEITFSGHGTAKDVNFRDSGKGLIIPRGNSGVINIKGQVAIMTGTSSEKASFAFQQIGHSDANGMVTATGAADDEDHSRTNCLTSLFDNICHVAQNINLVVNELGERLAGVKLGGFFDRELDDLLG